MGVIKTVHSVTFLTQRTTRVSGPDMTYASKELNLACRNFHGICIFAWALHIRLHNKHRFLVLRSSCVCSQQAVFTCSPVAKQKFSNSTVLWQFITKVGFTESPKQFLPSKHFTSAKAFVSRVCWSNTLLSLEGVSYSEKAWNKRKRTFAEISFTVQLDLPKTCALIFYVHVKLGSRREVMTFT